MAYNAAWEQHLVKFNIYPYRHRLAQAPSNLSNIQAMLNYRWPSLDNSDDDYSKLLKNNREANSKSSAMTLVISTFLGNLDIPHEQGIWFGNLSHLTDDPIFIAMPKPDFYDGSRPSTIDFRLREELANLIVPSKNPAAAILPTFLMVVAAPSTKQEGRSRAAWNYGAFAARGIHNFRNHISRQTLNDKRAYILAEDFDPKTCLLRLYTTHVVINADKNQLHTVTCGYWKLDDDAEIFRTAISALRNAREWARDEREKC